MRSPNAARTWTALTTLLLVAAATQPRRASTAPAVPDAPPADSVVLKLGHSGYISAVGFTADGTLVSVDGMRPEVFHWNPGERTLKHGCFNPPPTRGAGLSPRGRWLVATGDDAGPGRGPVTLYDSRTGVEAVRMEGEPAAYEKVSFSANEEFLAAVRRSPGGGGESQVVIWKAGTGELLRSLPVEPGTVEALALSADGQRLAASMTLGRSGEVRLWDLRTGNAEPPLATSGHQLRFSPDGKQLAVVARDLKLWDLHLRTGRVLHSDEELGRVHSATFSPDGKEVAVVVANPTRSITYSLRLLKTSEESQARHLFGGRWARATPLAFSPDGRWLAAGSGSHVLLWDRTAAQPAAQRATMLGAVHTPVRAVALSPDGRLLATAADDRVTRLWDPATGELRKTLPIGFQALAFSPDGRWLGIAGEGVHLYDVRAGELLPPVAQRPVASESIAFSPDGKWLVVGGPYDPPRLWDVATRRPGPPLEGRSAAPTFSPDSALLVGGGLSDTGTLFHVWSTRTWARERQFPAHEGTRPALTFSPDGKTLVTGGDVDRTLRAWNVRDWTQVRKLEGLEGSVRAIRYLPDGKTAVVLASQYDTEVFLWEPRSGIRQRTLFRQKAREMRTMDLSRDGKRLVLGAIDGSTLILDAATGRLLATLHPVPLGGGPADSGWIAYTPEGYYTASPGAETFLFWPVDGRLQSTPELLAKFHRPDRVRAALLGTQ